MEPRDLLMTVFSLAAVRLPVLIAVAIGLAWVLNAPRGPVRNGALAGLLLLAFGSLAGMLLNLFPMWLVSQGNFAAVAGISDVLGTLRFVLELVQALAVVLLVWALTRALRGVALPPAA